VIEENIDELAERPDVFDPEELGAFAKSSRAELAEAKTAPKEAQNLHDEARAYLLSASAYLTPCPPRLVALGGLSGSGKTYLARRLAPGFGARPGALHLRSDLLSAPKLVCSPGGR
jgi:hypothetical protein